MSRLRYGELETKKKNRKVSKKHNTKNEYDYKGNPLPEWITQEELVATISHCTHTLKTDVNDILNCYYMLLYEALMKGFKVNFPEIGYFANRYIPIREGEYDFGDGRNSGEYKTSEHNRPTFTFHQPFIDKMKSLTSDNPYCFPDSPYSGDANVKQNK